MDVLRDRNDVLRQLKQDILQMQRLAKPATDVHLHKGLEPVEAAFPGGVLPVACVHEFTSYRSTASAATSGFICGLMSGIMQRGGLSLWISTRRMLNPAALRQFSVAADRIIFIDVANEKLALWAIEQALQCDALATVVGEVRELSFTESRRLQLAVERSHVTAFIHRYYPRSENTTACVSRWKIEPVPSDAGDLPGMGLPLWRVQLQKVRNGKTGSWLMQWSKDGFSHIEQMQPSTAQIIPFGKTA